MGGVEAFRFPVVVNEEKRGHFLHLFWLSWNERMNDGGGAHYLKENNLLIRRVIWQIDPAFLCQRKTEKGDQNERKRRRTRFHGNNSNKRSKRKKA